MGWPAALILASALVVGPSGSPAPREPAARTIESTSRVVYAAAPDAPHRLVTTYAGAERVRWQLSIGAGLEQQRQVHWRHGDRAFVLEKQSSASRELEGEERARQLAHMELRRALLSWPDGFAWKREGEEQCADRGALGSLRARFAKPGDARPSEIADFDAGGTARDAYRRIRWVEVRGRSRPSSAELHHGGELVWTETFEKVDARARYLDGFFLPPDLAASASIETTPVQMLDVPATCTRRVELASPAGAIDWQRAVEEIEAVHAEWRERLKAGGHKLEGKATVELGPGLEPKVCVLRLEQVPAVPPEGFTTTPARKVAALPVEALSRLDARHVRRLTTAAPAGTDTRSLYVRFDLGSATVGGAVILLTLP